MLINQQLPGLVPANPRISHGTSNSGTADNPVVEGASANGSHADIVDRCDITSQRATIIENLSASSGAAPNPEMAQGLLGMLKGHLSTEASSALKAQAGGIRSDAARLLED